MAQSTSNVVPAAQTALKNMQSLNFGSSLGQLQQNNANISRFANPSLVVTPSGKIAPKTTGIGPVASATGYGGMINPRTVNPAKTQPLASSSLPGQLTGDQSSGNPYANLGDAKTPEQLAAEAKARGATSGPGSLLPGTDATATSNTGTSSVYSQTNPATYSGLVTQLANTSSQPSADYLKQQEQANAYNEALKQSRMNEAGGLAANAENPIPLEFQTGRAQVLQSQYAQEQAALGSAFQGASTLQGAANTQQGLQQTGLTSAAGLAQPSLAGYNQQAFNPLTGTFSSGQGGGTSGTAMSQLPSQGQSAVQSYATQIKNGQMTRADAESRLSAYGQPGLNALNEALGSGFNTNASNASAGTTAAGQQIQTAVEPANKALDALQVAYNNLPGITQTPIPALNGFLQNLAMSTGPGRDQVSAFQGALQEARSRIDGALQGIIGVDAARAQATALLPDNMVPTELPQKIAAAKQYLQNQLKSYVSSGQQTNTGTNTGSSTAGTIQTNYGTINPNL